jgi:DNA repair protein SbcD/Mre11
MASDIRILLLADSHLGFDLPVRPRTGRRRRGPDFVANYRAALAPALAGRVDAVVHGGDVFDRPGVDATVAYQAFEPLARIADGGVPVFIVAGNHERSQLPHHRLAVHPDIHVFDRARTFVVEIRGTRVAFAGLPFERRDVRTRFPELLERTAWAGAQAAIRLLCLHQCVEGATVGPADFMFRCAADVIRLRDIPADFAAVLSGHIHRQQVLTDDLHGRVLPAPVLYPGSIERTSYAEAAEPKGCMIVHVADVDGAAPVSWEIVPLPARPMIQRELTADGLSSHALESAVRAMVEDAPPDAILCIRLRGDVAATDLRVVSAARLRAMVPPTMNVEVRVEAMRRRSVSARPGSPGQRQVADPNFRLDL